MVPAVPSLRVSVTGGPASPEGTLGLPESAVSFTPAAASRLGMVNEEALPGSRPSPVPPWGLERVARPPGPAPLVNLACVPGLSEGDRGRGGGERAGRGAWTDSWPQRRGAGVAGGRGLGSNFPEKQPTCSRNDSKRRRKKKFSYHVEPEDSQSIFQMGSAFPVPV